MALKASQVRKAIAAASAAVIAIAALFGADLDSVVEKALVSADLLVGVALVYGLVNED